MCLGENVSPGNCYCSGTHWQQYYDASYMAYHGLAALAVPRRPAQPTGISGTFYSTLTLSCSSSLLTL